MKRKFLVFLGAFLLLFGASVPAMATPMPLDGSWIVLDEIMVDGDYFTGNWDWTSSYDVVFDITDLYVVTDAYNVYDNGVLVLTTPNLSDSYSFYTGDPDVAWASSLYSSGSITFAAGYHNITIMDYDIPSTPFGGDYIDGTVAFRATVVPEPGTMLLLGTGLMAVAGISRKKFRKR